MSRGTWKAGVVLACAVVLNGCDSKDEHSADSLPPVAVRVAAVSDKARSATEEVVGTVRPKLRAVIEAKVSGRIEQLAVAPGQQVIAGGSRGEGIDRAAAARIEP